MAYSTAIPGVPGGPVETSFPVHLKIAPAWRTNVRPGVKARSPRLPVQHETANPRSMAVDDATYLYLGSGGRQASWHMTVDDIEAYIGIPLDEITWQASDGAGPGNYNGISCELAVASQIVNNASRRAKSQKNAAELMGKIGARLNAVPPAKRHYDYAPDKKWCPAQMLNRNEWNRYVDWWHQFYNEEKARMAGGGSDAFKKGDHLIVTADRVNIRVGYGTNYRVLRVVEKGDRMTVIADDVGDSTQWADGYLWAAIRIDGWGTGWIATGSGSTPWVEKTAAPPKPEPEPEKPTYVSVSPVPELLETNMRFEDKYHTAEGITSIDGQDFIFVADVIEFKRTSPAMRYAIEGGGEVKAPAPR